MFAPGPACPVTFGAQVQQAYKTTQHLLVASIDARAKCPHVDGRSLGAARDARNGKDADMGCNVSKDVKVEDQGKADNAINGRTVFSCSQNA